MSHSHNHSHSEQHSHGHHHHHARTDNIGIAFALNFGFAILELIGGTLTNSVAIASDALHDLGDSFSIGTAWLLERYSRRNPDSQYSYGYRRFSLLGALINAVILSVGSLLVLREAITRLATPEPFDKGGVLVFALIGVTVNGFAALRLRKEESMNARAMAWHMLEDVLGWAAILLMGLVSLFIDAPILDPLLSIGISALVLSQAARLLINTGRLFLQAVPRGVDLPKLEAQLRSIDGVQSVHDMRVWSLDGEHNVLSVHLLVDNSCDPATLQRIKRESRSLFDSLHLLDSSIQIDLGEEDCVDARVESVSVAG